MKQTIKQVVVILGLAVVIILGLNYLAVYTDAGFFQWRWNPYAVLSMVAVVSSSYLVFAINRVRIKANYSTFFTFFVLTLVWWGICEMLQRLAATPETARFWSNLAPLGWIFTPLPFLMFTAIYTGREQTLARIGNALYYFLPAVFFLFLAVNTDLIIVRTDTAITREAWGYATGNGKLFPIFLAWFESLFIISVAWLVIFYRASKRKIERKQTLLLLFGLSIPLIGGTITDGILPIFNIEVMPTAILLTTAMAGIITYSLRRYSAFSFDLASVSEEILQVLPGSVVVLGPDRVIQFANPSFEKLLECSSLQLIDHSLEAVIDQPAVFKELEDRLLNSVHSKPNISLPDVTIRSASGKEVPVNIQGAAIKDQRGRVLNYILAVTDITPLKEKAHEIEQKNAELELAEDRLTNERDRATAIVSSMAEGLMVVDKDLGVVSINPAAEKLLGMKAKDCLGKNWVDLVTTYQDGRMLKLEEHSVMKTLQTGGVYVTELDDNNSYKTAGGRSFPITATTAPLRDKKGGKISGAVVVFRDVTNEKEIQSKIEREVVERTKEVREGRARLLASINSLKAGFVMTDKATSILLINSAAIQMLCPQSVIGGSVSPTHPERSCSFADIAKELEHNIDLESEVKHCMRTRKIREAKNIEIGGKFLHLFVSPIISNGEVIGTVILTEDVTEATVLERSKDEFFSIASHELRTPLTAIRGNTDLINQFYGDKVKKEPELAEMINDIHESSIRLIQIVNDFLDLSRIQQRRVAFNISELDMVGLVGEVVEEVKGAAAERGLTLILKKPRKELPFVFADAGRTKQVLINLIGNGIKYSEKGSVTVSFDAINGAVKVLVADTGRGIPLENQKLLFRKFQQAGSSILTRDTTKGTGLGLYISKMLSEGMGGSVALETSVVGKGSVFSLTLPTKKLVSRKPVAPSQPAVPEVLPTGVGKD